MEHGPDVFRVGRSGNKIVLNVNLNTNKSYVRNLRKSFLPERVLPFWNALPISVKNSSSVNEFKINLRVFKSDCISKGVTENHHSPPLVSL